MLRESRCFLVGVDERDVAWLVSHLRNMGLKVVDVPDFRGIQLHLSNYENRSLVLIDRFSLDKTDHVFFYNVPKLSPSFENSNFSNFAYSEWRAALEAAFSDTSAHIINKGWILRNCSLRTSDKFWTHRCQRILNKTDLIDFSWKQLDCEIQTYPSDNIFEVSLTRKRWSTLLPNLYDFQESTITEALIKIQDVLYQENLDFLRLWFKFSENKELLLSRASAELPLKNSLPFLKTLNDFI